MPRYVCNVYADDRQPRYLVLWSLEWEVIECRRLECGTDFAAAMRRAIACAGVDDWMAEDAPDFGFVFLRRGAARRLLMLTRRNPSDAIRQSFNPFRA